MSVPSLPPVTREYESSVPTPARWLQRVFLILAWGTGVWCGLFAVVMLVVQGATPDPTLRAVIRMALGVVFLWILAGGALSLALRRPLRAWATRQPRHWRLLFVLGAIALALLEEAVTTSMTNLAPYWGVSIARAHITASGDYLDVVLLHSVIVFAPMFIAWAWLLKRYSFTPAMVFILYGLTGLLAEWGTFGVYPFQIAFWIYVYGLMVFLPAHLAPLQRTARAPGVLACLLAVVLPLLAAIPVALVVQYIHSAWFASLP